MYAVTIINNAFISNVYILFPFVAQTYWCTSHNTPYAKIRSLVWRINAGFHSKLAVKLSNFQPSEYSWSSDLSLMLEAYRCN